MKTLQNFAAAHGSVHKHLAQERHLVSREVYKPRSAAALAAWRRQVDFGLTAPRVGYGAADVRIAPPSPTSTKAAQ